MHAGVLNLFHTGCLRCSAAADEPSNAEGATGCTDQCFLVLCFLTRISSQFSCFPLLFAFFQIFRFQVSDVKDGKVQFPARAVALVTMVTLRPSISSDSA